MPVPKPAILAERVPVLPVALVNTPLGDRQLEELVVKLCELGCPYTVGFGRVARPYTVVIGGGWQQVTNKDGEYTRWLVADIEGVCPDLP